MLRDPFPIIYVDDLESSLTFYVDLLGLQPGYRWPEEGTPQFVVLRQAEAAVGLAASSVPRDLLGVEPGSAPRFELCLSTDDVDEALGRLRAAGVAVLREPEDMPWGERMAYVEDPDANPVQITGSRRG